ncbi:hypothetical protein TWF788_010706 [Orbilia oligospora]|uniref:Uncharacterized protein n=1 Tax=Orbilia oligospora TaxID=2813651 RepID=A0A7C8KAE5_ORBOL|nr:hypothetical protein TWF788_010706 [Orbilia oligospora]
MASHDERRRSSRNSISSTDAELIRDHSRRLGLASPSASSASSQLLDPSTVGALSSHFDQLLGAIAGRIESVCTTCSLIYSSLSIRMLPTSASNSLLALRS